MPYLHIFFAIALLGVAHWIPYLRPLIGKPIEHPIRLNINYTIGILCIFVPFTDWLIGNDKPTDPVWISQVMWTFIAASGLAVVMFYAVDYGVAWLVSLFDERKLNDIKKKKLDAESQRKQ